MVSVKRLMGGAPGYLEPYMDSDNREFRMNGILSGFTADTQKNLEVLQSVWVPRDTLWYPRGNLMYPQVSLGAYYNNYLTQDIVKIL